MKPCFTAPLLLLSAALTGCMGMNGWQTVHGSGNVITENRQVSQFDRVSVSGAGELTVVQGEDESLSVEADDNLLLYLRSEQDRGRLAIGPQNVNLRPTRTIRYLLHVRNLRGLHLSGSVKAELGTIKTDRLALHVSGSGSVNVGRLDASTLSIHISGSGQTSATGQVEMQDIHISGSGNHRAPDLKCSEAKADISGSGHVSLWVVDSLSTHLSGSGGVEYRGRPIVHSHISGSGREHHIGNGD